MRQFPPARPNPGEHKNRRPYQQQHQDRRLGQEELCSQQRGQQHGMHRQPQQHERQKGRSGASHPFRHQFKESFSCLPARKRGCLEGLMVISSPVWGLRPLPPARVATTKTPKPVRRTSSPALREAAMRSNTPSTALAASFLGRPVVSESFWMRSFLFTDGSFSLVASARAALFHAIRSRSGTLGGPEAARKAEKPRNQRIFALPWG